MGRKTDLILNALMFIGFLYGMIWLMGTFLIESQSAMYKPSCERAYDALQKIVEE